MKSFLFEHNHFSHLEVTSTSKDVSAAFLFIYLFIYLLFFFCFFFFLFFCFFSLCTLKQELGSAKDMIVIL